MERLRELTDARGEERRARERARERGGDRTFREPKGERCRADAGQVSKRAIGAPREGESSAPSQATLSGKAKATASQAVAWSGARVEGARTKDEE